MRHRVGTTAGRTALAAMAILGAALVGPAATSPAAAAGHPDEVAVEAEFVADVNALRASLGLSQLEVDAGLVAKARSHSEAMAGADAIWHSDLSEGITADWQKLGENVGRGGSEDSLHQAFIDSPTHYANLVDPAWDVVGIGITITDEGVIYVAEEFMELSAAARSARTTASEPPPAPASADTTTTTATTPTTAVPRPSEPHGGGAARPSPRRDGVRAVDATGPVDASSSPVHASAGPRVSPSHETAALLTVHLTRLRNFAA